jgi:ribonuclease G
MNKAVITQLHNVTFLLIYEEDKLVECHPLQQEQALQIGSIYIGRVEKVVKNIQSAFIRLDKDNVGYLPLNDKPALVLNRRLPKGLSSLAENDLILVQVEQEPQKMKQARVTGNICLSGKYVALDLQMDSVGVSKKIQNPQRERELRYLLSNQNSNRNVRNDLQTDIYIENTKSDVYDAYGCVFRTACENAENALILAEYEAFYQELTNLLYKAVYERKTGCIKAGKPEYLALLEEYGTNRLDEVKTDIYGLVEELKNTVANVSLYDNPEYPLYKLLGLETELDRLLSKRVWLKSGGFLVIEPTEAMVVIDVNTGKSVGKKNRDNHIFKINQEAAVEVARQMRLRNLSGIIVVDFINMEDREQKQHLVHLLEGELKKDKVPSHFVEITRLDLYELTRKKIRKPIHELLPNFKKNLTIVQGKNEEV